MTTLQLKAAADPTKSALAGLDLSVVLRDMAFPAYFHDLGYPAWARGRHIATLAAGANSIDLPPLEVRNIRVVQIVATAAVGEPMTYIGDDRDEIFRAVVNADVGGIPTTPNKFWRGFGGTDYNRVFFNAIADVQYRIGVEYLRLVPYNGVDEIQLDNLIPTFAQWPLVLLLQAEIAKHRQGQGDSRYQAIMAEYGQWLERVTENKEGGTGGAFAYVD